MVAPQFDVGILAEKKIQAEQYAAALGGGAMRDGYIEVARSPLGRAVIIWGWGHVDRLEEPRDEGEEFRDWRSKVWPHINARPRVLPSDDPKCKRQITAAKKLLPQCAMVIGASDPDREGETIWRHFLELTGARPRAVKRMICAESNPGPQRAAFLALKDPDQYYGRFVAGRARSVIDLWEGTNHTVACSVFLRPGDLGKGYWPMGRVKGAVLGILHRRHVEIRDFREVAYFEILAEVRVRAGTVTLRHAPSAEERLTDRAAALALAEAARGIAEPLTVEQKPVETAPPKLFSKTSFLTRAGALWGWSGDKSAEILQGLYQDKGLITYPRAELTVVASSDVEKAPRVMEQLRGLGEPFRSAIDRLDGRLTVRRSVVNDREVAEASHTAIIPTDVPADGLHLTEDEAKAYRLIAQRYVAAFMPSAQGLRTTVSMVPRSGPCRDRLFRAAGTVETEPGWRVLFGADDGEAEEGGETDRLTPVADGETGTVSAARLEDKRTRPPVPYTETSILEAMLEVHRLVPPDKEHLREILKSSKGVGTPATRETVIKELIASQLVERGRARGKGTPPIDLSGQGIMLVEALLPIVPELVQPETTALLEMDLDRIERARDSRGADRLAEQVLEDARERILRQFEAIRANGRPPEPSGSRPAAPGQRAFVAAIAERLGLALPPERLAAMSAGEASAFIDEHKARFEECGGRAGGAGRGGNGRSRSSRSTGPARGGQRRDEPSGGRRRSSGTRRP